MKNDPAKYLFVICSTSHGSMMGLPTVFVRVNDRRAARRWLRQVHPGDSLFLNPLLKET